MKLRAVFFLFMCFITAIIASGCRNHVVPTNPALSTPAATSSATPVLTPGTTVTPVATAAGKFRMKTLNAYSNSVLQTNVTFTYSTGSTPTAMDQYLYDAAGNIVMSAQAVLDVNGNTVSATVRDASGNILSSVSSTISGGRVVRTSQFDSTGTLVGYVDFQYDALGRTTREDYYNASGTLVNSVFYQYNPGSSIPIRTTASPGASPSGSLTSTSTYDGLGRLIRIDFYYSGTLVQSQTMTYNAAGQITSTSAYDGSGTLSMTMTNTYDTHGNLTAMSMSSVPATFMTMNAVLTYDTNGNLIDETVNSSFNGTSNPVMRMVLTWEAY